MSDFGVWLVMLVCDLLIPITMLVFGCVFITNPPKNVNEYYGYRTPRSMQSIEAWNFAHRYFGRLWAILGGVIFVPTLAAMVFLLGKSQSMIANVGLIVCFAQCAVLCLPIIPTEYALKKRFG